MNKTHNIQSDMKTLWNGAAGNAWVESQSLLDEMFKPIEQALVKAAIDSGASNVLDIGCGAGTTTLTCSRALGEKGKLTGLDISAPLIEAANLQAKKTKSLAQFVCADAQEYTFASNAFDLIISRFGVMFFSDPVVAFTNLHKAANEEARLHMYAWRHPGVNDFMTTAMRAAAPFLPPMPKPEPNTAGQFGFADPDYVMSVLEEAGWKDAKLEKVDFLCSFPAEQIEQYNTRLGVLGTLLPELDENVRNKIISVVNAAFEKFISADRAQFTAACWKITARA